MKQTIRLKLILLFIAVGLIPLIIVSSLSYFVYYQNLLKVTVETASYNSDWAVSNINRYFKNIEQVSSIMESRSVARFLRESKDTPSSSWEIRSLFELYRKSLFDEKSVHNITIIGLNGKCHSERDGYYRLDPDMLLKNPTFTSILNYQEDKFILLPPQKANYRKNIATIETMSIGQILLDNTTLEVLGVIIIDVYPEEIEKYYQTGEGDIIGKMKLIYTSGKEDVNQGIPDINTITLDKELSIYKNILYENWAISYKISYEQLIKPINSALRITLIIFLGVILLIIFVFFFISQLILKPLKLLREHMELAASGDFNTQLVIKTNDTDIEKLQNSFNTMVYDLKNLMNQKEIAHKNYLQAHFRVLQQQINPHFLYNTLDTIVWMSLEKRYDDIIEMVEALSTFFRLNLSKGEEVIPVSDIILSLESYLTVQKIRYADSLQYSIEISDEVKQSHYLKLIIQPVVENALYHGIREKGHGTITVRGYRKEEFTYFTIEDNGSGMDVKRLHSVRNFLDNPLYSDKDKSHKGQGFGLKNVQNRIKLFYGSQYGISIKSEKDKGSLVIITLPWVE